MEAQVTDSARVATLAQCFLEGKADDQSMKLIGMTQRQLDTYIGAWLRARILIYDPDTKKLGVTSKGKSHLLKLVDREAGLCAKLS